MDVNQLGILHGIVMHARLFPMKNAFRYRMYYLCIPLSRIDEIPLSNKRFSWMSFRQSDHGYRDNRPIKTWAMDIFKEYKVDDTDGEIVMFVMPRIFGYAFNPVSFYICHDKSGSMKAVICEVNNTFGETHTYLCLRDNQTMQADKVFHVSPFLERNGYYDFNFEYTTNENFSAFIDYFNANDQKQLLTYLKGTIKPMTRRALVHTFFAYPLVTFKAIGLIHYQAIKLLFKKVKYISKPTQLDKKTSVTEPRNK